MVRAVKRIDEPLRIVDNRIVVGESTWMPHKQMTVIGILHPKQNKAHHRKAVQVLVAQFNEMLAERQKAVVEDPQAPPALIALSDK